MRTGTHHFESLRAAAKYYGTKHEAKRALSEGAIAIGPPTPKPGERITLDRDGRYWIEDDA